MTVELPSAGLTMEAAGNGVMLALVPPPAFVEALTDPDGEAEDDHHITLHYLGHAEDVGGEEGREKLHRALMDFTAHSGYRGLTGRFGGFGVFPPSPGSDGKHVLIALWDIPGGAEFRTWLGFYLDRHKVPCRQEDHGWISHQTIRYSEDPIRQLPECPAGLPEQAVFGSVVLAWGGEWQHYPLP